MQAAVRPVIVAVVRLKDPRLRKRRQLHRTFRVSRDFLYEWEASTPSSTNRKKKKKRARKKKTPTIGTVNTDREDKLKEIGVLSSSDDEDEDEDEGEDEDKESVQ